jgi:SPP1 gp7 family putative phage head morphogenesis protein
LAAIAQDELSSSALRDAMRKLSRRWLKRFDTMADQLADYFATAVSTRTDAQLKRILKDGGFSVEFKMSMAQRDVLNATIAENVSLIKSIPRQYLTSVEGIVSRSVQTGRDMKALSDDLQKAFGVTKRRAAIISRDQSNKATAMLTRARHLELGITENVWVHSAGGKHPRPTHVRAGQDGVKFDVATGWKDPATGKYIWPGTEINCRCIGRPVIKALS